ncbi:MAG TPA: MerR family transcriptional regulator [Rhodocyclaceae bacterium]|nr:MerR family transcriptional regulator [Rhodocyclaceae bacterium]
MNPTPPRKLTLGQIGRATGLARSSLLHYEALGLLAPAGRTVAGYRLYGEGEIERLRTIRRYREAGLSLAAIRDLLASPGAPGPQAGPHALLESRLVALCEEVERLREQQRTLARLLAAPEFRSGHACQGKDAWVALLRRAGFSDEDMGRWHADFERENPEGHAAFLASLGLAPAEIGEIRHGSRDGAAP